MTRLTPTEKERLSIQTKNLHVFLEDVNPDDFEYVMHVCIDMQSCSIHFQKDLDLGFMRSFNNRRKAIEQARLSIQYDADRYVQLYASTLPQKLENVRQQLTKERSDAK